MLDFISMTDRGWGKGRERPTLPFMSTPRVGNLLLGPTW